MANLKIKVFKADTLEPKTTITIPAAILKVASKAIPKKVAAALQEKGIELKEIVELSQNPDIAGTLVEIEEHEKNEKVVISIE